MPTATIKFEVEVPTTATDEQIEEWVGFELGEKAIMDFNNPLSLYELTSVKITDFKITK